MPLKVNKKKTLFFLCLSRSFDSLSTYFGEFALTVMTAGESADMTKPMGTAVANILNTVCHRMLWKFARNEKKCCESTTIVEITSLFVDVRHREF